MSVKYFPRGTHFKGPLKLGVDSTLIGEDDGGITAAVTLTADESNGQHYVLDNAAGFGITLPKPTQGWSCRFTIGTAFATTAYVFTAGTADTFEGCIIEVGAVQDVNAADIITLAADKENVGDYLDFWSDGTSTFVHGNFLVAASVAPSG